MALLERLNRARRNDSLVASREPVSAITLSQLPELRLDGKGFKIVTLDQGSQVKLAEELPFRFDMALLGRGPNGDDFAISRKDLCVRVERFRGLEKTSSGKRAQKSRDERVDILRETYKYRVVAKRDYSDGVAFLAIPPIGLAKQKRMRALRFYLGKATASPAVGTS